MCYSVYCGWSARKRIREKSNFQFGALHLSNPSTGRRVRGLTTLACTLHNVQFRFSILVWKNIQMPLWKCSRCRQCLAHVVPLRRGLRRTLSLNEFENSIEAFWAEFSLVVVNDLRSTQPMTKFKSRFLLPRKSLDISIHSIFISIIPPSLLTSKLAVRPFIPSPEYFRKAFAFSLAKQSITAISLTRCDAEVRVQPNAT